MELRVNIGLNQVVGLIRNLPYDDKLILKSQLDKELRTEGKQSNSSLKQILLKGPVMTPEGYDNYKDSKKQFSKWTKKLSV